MWSFPLLFWLVCAVGLFWAVGAYNRLVRLRTDVRKAFAMLDEQLLRQVIWVQGCVPAALRELSHTLSGEPELPMDTAWRRLYAASEQFAVALAQVRAHTIDGTASASLAMAHGAMVTAWEGAMRAAADPQSGSAEPDLPERVQVRWVTLLHEALPLEDAFNAAVGTYNRALGEFPAIFLTRLFGFRHAGTIGRLAPAHLSEPIELAP